MPKLKDNDKFNIVISKNTFFFHNEEFEEMHEGYISSLIQTLLVLKQKIEEKGLKKEVFIDFIMEKEEGLKALLALLGFSKESLLRLITFIRVYDDSELNNLVKKEFWPQEDFTNEWNEDKIVNLVKNDRNIAEGLINLFFEGSTISAIRKNLPLFEFKKLDINKLNFSPESLIDTIIRYKTKGAYKASAGNNPEALLERLILMSTDEGDIVLDPFIGAGTTALTAKRLKRNFIGIDNDKKYVETTVRKLKEVKPFSSNGYVYSCNGNSSNKNNNPWKNHTVRDDELKEKAKSEKSEKQKKLIEIL